MTWGQLHLYPLLQSTTQIARFMGKIWDPPGSCRPQVGPINLAVRVVMLSTNLQRKFTTGMTKDSTLPADISYTPTMQGPQVVDINMAGSNLLILLGLSLNVCHSLTQNTHIFIWLVNSTCMRFRHALSVFLCHWTIQRLLGDGTIRPNSNAYGATNTQRNGMGVKP